MPLQPGEVKTEHIATGAVTTPKIADEAITTDKLKDSAVKTEKIATGAITGSKIGEAQVTASRIQDKAITTEKLATGAVTTEKIANASVTPAKLSFTPPSITRPITPPLSGVEIADGAVTKPKLASDIASYVPRKVAVPDFGIPNFTFDGAVHANGLDLSGIVPAGAKGVILGIDLVGGASGAVLNLGTDFTAYPEVYAMNRATVGWNDHVAHWVLPIETDRKLDYQGGIQTPSYLAVTVIGWFI